MMNALTGKCMFLMFLVISLATSGCSKKTGILLLGLDHRGKEVHEFFPLSGTDQVGEAMEELAQQTFYTLENVDHRNPWELNRVFVGLGLGARAGIGSVSVEAEPGIEIIFVKE